MTTTTTNTTADHAHVHPFTATGHGHGPWKLLGVEEKVYQACQGAPIQAAGSCEVCLASLRWCYRMVDVATGHQFIVGCDCACKADPSWRPRMHAAKKAYLAEARRVAREASTRAALEERQAVEAARTAGRAAGVAWLEASAKTCPVRHAAAGTRMSFTAIVERRIVVEGRWGTKRIIVLRTVDGHRVAYFTSGIAEGGRQGEAVRVTATIKSHGEYEGHPQTTVQRAKFERIAA